MDLQELKDTTYRAWENRCRYNSAIVQPEQFELEISTYGDLSERETWEKAYSIFQASNIEESCLDAHELITVQFNYPADHDQFALRCRVFEVFIALPDGLEMLKAGLEDLLMSDNFTQEERSEANGFFEMVSYYRRIGTDRRDTIRPLERFLEPADSTAS